MKEDLITFKTSKLAKEKGFDWETQKVYDVGETNIKNPTIYVYGEDLSGDDELYAPTQSSLQKFIREKRGVHIEIHRNASGYYWSMCMSDGGTDLGWSDHTGPNHGGVWDSFEGALENALQVQLSYDLPNDVKVIKHWGNYVIFAIKKFKENER